MRIIVLHKNKSYGPFTLEEVRSYLSSGQIVDTDLAQIEGEGHWMPLLKIPDLSPQKVPSSKRGLEPVQLQEPEDTRLLSLEILSLFLSMIGGAIANASGGFYPLNPINIISFPFILFSVILSCANFSSYPTRSRYVALYGVIGLVIGFVVGAVIHSITDMNSGPTF